MKSREIQWQCWDFQDGSISTAPKEVFDKLFKEGGLPREATLLHHFSAATMEEALSIVSLRMGHGPYTPTGEAELCMNGCGSYYYPKGSGECPSCGEVRKPIHLKEVDGFDDVVRDNAVFAQNHPDAITYFGDISLCLHESEQNKEHLRELFAGYREGFEKSG